MASSAHVNSIWWRTVFSEISCEEEIRTVTTLPNAHVCSLELLGPFLLDGEMRKLSINAYVLIEGNLGVLRNWPNYSDFTLPDV